MFESEKSDAEPLPFLAPINVFKFMSEVVEPPSKAIKMAPATKVTTPDMRKIRYYFPTGGGVLMRTCTLSSQ